jgi:hypothetical protein
MTMTSRAKPLSHKIALATVGDCSGTHRSPGQSDVSFITGAEIMADGGLTA